MLLVTGSITPTGQFARTTSHPWRQILAPESGIMDRKNKKKRVEKKRVGRQPVAKVLKNRGSSSSRILAGIPSPRPRPATNDSIQNRMKHSSFYFFRPFLVCFFISGISVFFAQAPELKRIEFSRTGHWQAGRKLSTTGAGFCQFTLPPFLPSSHPRRPFFSSKRVHATEWAVNLSSLFHREMEGNHMDYSNFF